MFGSIFSLTRRRHSRLTPNPLQRIIFTTAMVVKTSEDPFSTADMRFPGPNGMSADASALLFRNGTHVALRIECSDGNLEFTDNAYIGTGKLFSVLSTKT